MLRGMLVTTKHTKHTKNANPSFDHQSTLMGTHSILRTGGIFRS